MSPPFSSLSRSSAVLICARSSLSRKSPVRASLEASSREKTVMIVISMPVITVITWAVCRGRGPKIGSRRRPVARPAAAPPSFFQEDAIPAVGSLLPRGGRQPRRHPGPILVLGDDEEEAVVAAERPGQVGRGLDPDDLMPRVVDQRGRLTHAHAGQAVRRPQLLP